VLFNEPKLLKQWALVQRYPDLAVSVLFNEPKLLKLCPAAAAAADYVCFSALQRAEIAEI